MSRNPKTMKNNKVNVAVIGIGRWGKNLLDTLKRQGVDVPFCFSNGNAENIRWLEEKHPNTKMARSFKEILKNKEITAVVIATPIDTHYLLAKQALDAGKHVFLEKPGTQSVKSMRELCDLADSKGLVLAVGYVFIHHPVCKYLMKVIENEAIQGINFEWDKWGSFGEKIVDNLLTHEISILKAFGLELDHEETFVTTIKGLFGNDDIISVQTMTEGGIPILILINRVSSEKRKVVTIITDKNIYSWMNNELRVAKKGESTSPVLIELPNTPSLDLEIKNFIDTMRGDSKLLVDGKFATDVLGTTLSL